MSRCVQTFDWYCTWMAASPCLSQMPWLPIVWTCNPETGVLYSSLLCSLFDSIYIFPIKCQNFLHLLSYHTLITSAIPQISKLCPQERATFLQFFYVTSFKKSYVRKDYRHILTSSCYRQKRATWQTNLNKFLGMSSPIIISVNQD